MIRSLHHLRHAALRYDTRSNPEHPLEKVERRRMNIEGRTHRERKAGKNPLCRFGFFQRTHTNLPESQEMASADAGVLDPLGKEGSQRSVGLVDEGLGGFPVDASVGNGYAVLEVIDGLGEGLVAGLQVAFDHRADDAEVLDALADDFAEDIRLLGRIFAAVGVAAVGHDGRFEAG